MENYYSKAHLHFLELNENYFEMKPFLNRAHELEIWANCLQIYFMQLKTNKIIKYCCIFVQNEENVMMWSISTFSICESG